MTRQFLAIDLGAESGRVMLGALDRDVLALSEVCRFPNEPIRQQGTLRWNIDALWGAATDLADVFPVQRRGGGWTR